MMGSLVLLLPRSGPPDPAVGQRMFDAAPHRGTATEAVVHGSCLLGVSTRGDAPGDASVGVAEGLAAAFVGSLDNVAELAAQLGLPNGERSLEPARVVAAAFGRFGEGALQRLRGTFAAAVSDGGRVWCFRDQAGFGQLFYRQDARGLCAATEAKQVVAGSGIGSEPDLEVVERIFYGDVDDTLPSALKGVDRLPKASLLSSDGRSTAWRGYWDPTPLLETARFTPDELRERFQELMTQAVARVLSGNDVVSLSGGIDSPAVAAFGASLHLERAGRPLAALSWVFPDHPKVDERTYIELVSSELGMPLHTYTPQAGSLDELEEWSRLCDGPVWVPPAATAETYGYARQLGYTTMLTGVGAEIVFDLDDYLLPHLASRGRVRALTQQVRHRRSDGAPWRSIARQLALAAAPHFLVNAYSRYGHSSGVIRFPAWLDPNALRRVNARYTDGAGWDRWRHLQLMFRMDSSIGQAADEMVQAMCGIKVRRPWTDLDLFEFFLSLPAEMKFPKPTSKALARDLLRGMVPDPILDRTDKTSFSDWYLSRIDYEGLNRLLVRPQHRLPGVRYDIIADLIERRDLDLLNYKWAVDLARAHAFLNQW